MRRITKKVLIFMFGAIFTGFYCEYIIYYIVIAQCSWPSLEQSKESAQTLKAFILADTHLLGPRKGHWLDKWRREWQMHQAFQVIITLHVPDVVFVLGDLFDEGEWSDDNEFQDYVERFQSLFSVPNNIKMHVVAGNHDIGFHQFFSPDKAQRFSKLLNTSSSVKFVTIKKNHFVLLNSMAMHGDSCNLCTEARYRIYKISEKLKCSQNSSHSAQCRNTKKKIDQGRPILLQHFPLFRVSDAECKEPDAQPLPDRNHRFLPKRDSLSKEATDDLVSKIAPRAVFGGHTHHGCLIHHEFKNPDVEFNEYSVPSFSWRNRPDPKYMLVTITPDDYAVHKCGLPRETTIIMTGVMLLSFITFSTIRIRKIGRM